MAHFQIKLDSNIFLALAQSKLFDWEVFEFILKNKPAFLYLKVKVAVWSQSFDQLKTILEKQGDLDLLTDLAALLHPIKTIRYEKLLLPAIDQYLNNHFGTKSAIKIQGAFYKIQRLNNRKLSFKFADHIAKNYKGRKSLREVIY